MAQSVAILAALVVAFIQLRATYRSNRTVTSLAITGSHREIWNLLFSNPELERVVETNVELEKEPVTKQEEYFVILIISHMTAAYDAYREGMYRTYKADIKDFFKLPIPANVWNNIKEYQAPEFVKFVDQLLNESRE